MVTHGSKRFHEGHEQIFHHTYGWISFEEFFDLMPESEQSSEEEPDLEPDYLSRQSGESFEHYHKRLRDMEEYDD